VERTITCLVSKIPLTDKVLTHCEYFSIVDNRFVVITDNYVHISKPRAGRNQAAIEISIRISNIVQSYRRSKNIGYKTAFPHFVIDYHEMVAVAPSGKIHKSHFSIDHVIRTTTIRCSSMAWMMPMTLERAIILNNIRTSLQAVAFYDLSEIAAFSKLENRLLDEGPIFRGGLENLPEKRRILQDLKELGQNNRAVKGYFWKVPDTIFVS
jgi:hypothetical protein